eukprot:CAMPEP_0197683586 /NCGR_PEP_ID=MMETSP1338-20131121/98191_1 /TAXON_ID=43686 ORGANISM="Pelagodinium beii, Strain RCC1491" /NCGR_SAMPLE_ID=MMETSP1338 /ASSEMBLY_ACC=CAM_ASM_000754 /LENGTH=413 /DNA_ID=CAMNT_0043265197 /DNA_START=16 /DNA_END=1253 /DNA_ORIENTATION=-
MLNLEHERWMTGDSELLQVYVSARRQELDTVKRSFGDPQAQARVTSSLQARGNAYLMAVEGRAKAFSLRASKDSDVGAQARARWGEEVNQAIMTSLRQDWRSGQKKLLQQLSRDSRADRQAATDVLRQHLARQEALADEVNTTWEDEVARVKQQLDRLGQAYRTGLNAILQAQLLAMRQHASQQADFFRREIQEAAAVEQADARRSAAQLRRMKLALVKWQRQYLLDAQKKAIQLAPTADGRGAEDRVEGSEVLEATLDSDVEQPTSEAGDGGDATWQSEDRALEQQAKSEARGVLDLILKKSAETGQKLEPEEQVQQLEVARRQSLVRLRQEAAETRVQDCATVLEALWDHGSANEEEQRAFIQRLEDAVPYTPEVLRLYEEHLAKHGILAALAAPEASAVVPDEAEAAWAA